MAKQEQSAREALHAQSQTTPPAQSANSTNDQGAQEGVSLFLVQRRLAQVSNQDQQSSAM
jgi:hypothetical protein